MSLSRWLLASFTVALAGALACGSDPVAPVNPTVTVEGRLEKGDSARLVIVRDGANIPIPDATVTFLPATTAHLLPSGWVRFDAEGPLDVSVALTDGTTGHAAVAIGSGTTVTLTGRIVQGDSGRLTITRNGTTVAPGSVTVAITPATTGHLLSSGWVKFDATGALDVGVTFPDGASRHVSVNVAVAPVVGIALQGTLEKGDSARLVITSTGAPVATSSATVTFTPSTGAHLLASGWVAFDAAGALGVNVLLSDGAAGHADFVIAQPTVTVALQGTLLQGDSVQVVIRSLGATVPVQQATLTVTPSGSAHLLPSGWLRLDAVGSLDVAVSLPNGGSGHVAATVGAPAVTVTLQGRLERSDSVRVTVTREGVVVPPDQVQLTLTPAANARVSTAGWLVLTEAGSLDVAAVPATGGAAHVTVTVATPPMIVYDYLVGGNRDIYVAALDGRDVRRLTTNTGDDQHPSAAAGRVVFTSYRDGNAELYAIPLAGGTETRLTTTTANETDPALSPDGTRIAYISSAVGLARTWIASGTGTGATIQATGATSSTIEAQPVWNTSGSMLLLTSTLSGNADLYTYTPGGGRAALIPAASTGRPEVEGSFNPDGATLVFISDRPEGSGLFSATLTDTLATILVAGSVGQPTTLADGRVVFTQFAGSTSRLRWIDPATPSVIHDVPLGTGSAAHPAVVR